MLEQMARDVTGWPARVVEYFQVLATTQHMNHIRLQNRVTPNLRKWELLEYANTPFNEIPHAADVRCIAKQAGKYNIPNIGVHLWRLTSYALTESPARKLNNTDSDGRYLFSPLGLDTQLFTKPETEQGISHLAEPINVPMPISRRVLHEYKDRYYGVEKSFLIRENGSAIDGSLVVVWDLSDVEGGTSWANRPLKEDPNPDPAPRVAVDPELGRMVFLDGEPTDVTVTYHYGFSADMGGGEYDRAGSFDATLRQTNAPVKRVPGDSPAIAGAVAALGGVDGIVEIASNGVFNESLSITASAGQRIEVRAADGCRPVLELQAQITGGERAQVVINGLVIGGGGLRFDGAFGRLRLLHCTLVPSAEVAQGHLVSVEGPGLEVNAPGSGVEVDRCIILGGVQAVAGSRVQVNNSIVDAMDETWSAFGSPDGGDGFGGRLHITNSTVVGQVHTELMELASNTVFIARLKNPAGPSEALVRAERRQEGCVRFCYLPDGSIVPRRFRCQPDLALEKRALELNVPSASELPSDEKAGVLAMVQPTFTSDYYGDPGYCQLSRLCPDEIREGADDGAEMGAFHDLYQPQRETNLRIRLQEYLRFGLVAGIFYET
jgi:hypothetical protein